MTLYIIAALLLLSANMFFVLTEFSLVRVQRPRLELMVAAGRKRAALVLDMLKNLDRYLSAIQLGVTICTLGLGWLGEPLVSKFIESHIGLPEILLPYKIVISAVVAFAIITYVQIVFAELVPRSIAIHKAEQIALMVAYPFYLFSRLFRLPIWIMTRSFITISKLLGFPPTGDHEQVFSEDEVRILLNVSQEKGLIPLDRLLIIENLFDFGSMKVKEAMVPREKIHYLSTGKTWEENRNLILHHRLSRYPVGDPDLDHVIGLLHVKDLAFENPAPKDWKKLIRPAHIAVGADLLQTLLKPMTAQAKHMMLVRDNHGKIIGLITLEDVLEELVGEIHDEFDLPQAWSLHSMLTPAHVLLDQKSETLSDAVRQLVRALGEITPELDTAAALRAIDEREIKMATLVTKGVALPHARLPSLDKALIAIGRCLKPIPFPSLDKQPIRLILLILTPASLPMLQLRILARIAMLASHETFRRRLLRAKTPAQFLDIIKTSESLLAG